MKARAPVLRVLAIVLAGREGKRLAPLTADRARPAVPFEGSYRLVDFALSNLANAGYTQISVLTQYKSHSLDRHLTQTWRLNPMLANFVASVPAHMRRGPRWFAGSADAIYQNLNLIYEECPDYIINGVLASPARARSFGWAGRRRVLEQVSWSAIATRTAALYESLPSARLQAQPGMAGLGTARTASKRRPPASRRRASR